MSASDDGSVRDRLTDGFLDKPVLGVYLLVLLLLAGGFLVAGLVVLL